MRHLRSHRYPHSYGETTKSENTTQWQGAMNAKMDLLTKNGTWSLQPLPSKRRNLGSKWVYKRKCKADGIISRFKARFCAKGYSQGEGINYNKTVLPVVKYDSIRVLLALAAIKDSELRQFDVKTAFLNSDLEVEFYMTQSQGFAYEDSSLV